MIKNALLSLKKNIGKTILLFVIIVVITNLVIAGLSIQSATQKSMDLGLFEVKERTITNPDGSTRITLTTKVTGKGQVYFINKFLS